MKKQQYIQPQFVVETLGPDAAVMLLGTGTGISPAPERPNMGAVE